MEFGSVGDWINWRLNSWKLANLNSKLKTQNYAILFYLNEHRTHLPKYIFYFCVFHTCANPIRCIFYVCLSTTSIWLEGKTHVSVSPGTASEIERILNIVTSKPFYMECKWASSILERDPKVGIPKYKMNLIFLISTSNENSIKVLITI